RCDHRHRYRPFFVPWVVPSVVPLVLHRRAGRGKCQADWRIVPEPGASDTLWSARVDTDHPPKDATVHLVEALQWDHRPTLNAPVMLCAFEGWTDAGGAASGAASY